MYVCINNVGRGLMTKRNAFFFKNYWSFVGRADGIVSFIVIYLIYFHNCIYVFNIINKIIDNRN